MAKSLPQRKDKQKNFSKGQLDAINVVLKEFKSPLGVVEFITDILPNINPDLVISTGHPERDKDMVNCPDVIVWHLSQIQKFFLLRHRNADEAIQQMNWFTDLGNAESIFLSLSTTLVHFVCYQSDYGPGSFYYEHLPKLHALLLFAKFLFNEESRKKNQSQQS